MKRSRVDCCRIRWRGRGGPWFPVRRRLPRRIRPRVCRARPPLAWSLRSTRPTLGGFRLVVRDAQKVLVALLTVVSVLLLSCCVVSVLRSVVLQVNDQFGGNLHRGVLHVVSLGHLEPDAPSQPWIWSVPGFRFSRSPASMASKSVAFNFWPGTDRAITVTLGESGSQHVRKDDFGQRSWTAPGPGDPEQPQCGPARDGDRNRSDRPVEPDTRSR